MRLTLVAAIVDTPVDLERNLADELEDDEQDEDPDRVVEDAELVAGGGHPETQHHGRHRQHVGDGAHEEVDPVEVRALRAARMAPAEREEGLQWKQSWTF